MTDQAYSPDNPPPPTATYNCPCGTGDEPCPGPDGRPACSEPWDGLAEVIYAAWHEGVHQRPIDHEERARLALPGLAPVADKVPCRTCGKTVTLLLELHDTPLGDVCDASATEPVEVNGPRRDTAARELIELALANSGRSFRLVGGATDRGLTVDPDDLADALVAFGWDHPRRSEAGR